MWCSVSSTPRRAAPTSSEKHAPLLPENSSRDSMGAQVCDVLDSPAPASLAAIRGMIVLGLVGSANMSVQVDVEAAYLHADLIGPPYYLEVPRVASSPVRRPVLRLHKAIPGLQQSGALWHDLADRIVRHHGWLPVLDVAQGVYYKDDAHGNLLVLALYFDNWIFGWPSQSIREEVCRLSKAYSQEKGPRVRPRHHRPPRLLPRHILPRDHLAWPRSDRVHRAARAAKPKLRPSPVPIATELDPLTDYENPGEYHEISAQLIGALLWIVRCGRPDLAYSVSLIARFSSR